VVSDEKKLKTEEAELVKMVALHVCSEAYNAIWLVVNSESKMKLQNSKN
jgi:hypothetical protein